MESLGSEAGAKTSKKPEAQAGRPEGKIRSSHAVPHSSN